MDQNKLKLYTLYIGYDNKTKKAFKESLINSLVNKYFEGYSIQKITGYYKGTKEDSYKVEIITEDQKKVNNLKTFLIKKLDQESILKTTQLLNIEF